MRRSRPAMHIAASIAMVSVCTSLAHSYQEVTVGDGGTITGKVVFQGPPPPMKKIIPTKDQEVCGDIREEPQIVLAGDNGVQHSVTYLKEVEAGKEWTKPVKIPELTNLKCHFEPHIQVIPVGSDIEIVNSDPVLHNTHGFLEKRTVFSVLLPNQGDRARRPLKRTGIVRVECDAHGWMLGWIYVADNPYYAVTTKDGTFSIPDVPPGTYTLVTWHEYTGPVEVPVIVKAKEVVPVTVELKQ